MITPHKKDAEISQRWRTAAKEVLTCLGIATAIGLPAYGIADWWHHKDIGKAGHGGQVRMTGQHHVELVVKSDRLVVYVTDHEGRASDLKDTIISAQINHDSAPRPLIPTDGNSMELRGDFKFNENTMVFITIDTNCTQPEKTVFTPLRPEPPLPPGLGCTAPQLRPTVCRQHANPN